MDWLSTSIVSHSLQLPKIVLMMYHLSLFSNTKVLPNFIASCNFLWSPIIHVLMLSLYFIGVEYILKVICYRGQYGPL